MEIYAIGTKVKGYFSPESGKDLVAGVVVNHYSDRIDYPSHEVAGVVIAHKYGYSQVSREYLDTLVKVEGDGLNNAN